MKLFDKSNNNSSPQVYSDIPYYQVQKINVNKIKDKRSKINKSSYGKEKIDKIILTCLKEKDPIYLDREGLTNNKKNKK